MSQLLEADNIDDDTLAGCDVLVIKIPTARYTQDEADAVVRFVKRGGGVLFIGDHTNLDRSGAYMNDMTRSFGFVFRDDLLFGTTAWPYDEHYEAAPTPHPAVQRVLVRLRRVLFGRSRLEQGPGGGPGNGPVEHAVGYHMSNYHPFRSIARKCDTGLRAILGGTLGGGRESAGAIPPSSQTSAFSSRARAKCW